MALQDTLGQSFSAGGFDLSQAGGQLTTAFGGIAPGGVDVDAQAVASLAATIAQADPTGAVGSVAQLAGKYGQTLSGLADPAHIGDAFTAAVDSIGSLGTHLAGLRTGLVGALTTTPPGDRPVDRFVAGTDPFRALHVGPLGAVLRTLAPGAVPSLPAGLTGIVPALLGQAAAVRTLAEQLALLTGGATVASRARTLGDALTATSDPTRLDPATTAVLALDGAALAARVASADPDDVVVADVTTGLAVLGSYADAANQLLLGGLAVLDVLDPAPLGDLLRGAATGAGTAVTTPVHELSQALATQLGPVLSFRPKAPSAASVTAFADTFAAGLGQAVTAVQGLDVAQVAAPVQNATDTVLGPIRLVSTTVHDALQAVSSALAAARTAVESIGLDTVVQAVHTLIDPVVNVIDQLRALLAPVATALGTIATTVSAELASLRHDLDETVATISGAFHGLQQAVDGLHLTDQLAAAKTTMDEVASTIEGVHIGQAVDAAVGFVHDAAGVISKVPFDLLPEGAKADLHNAVAPIKAIDFEADVRDPLSGTLEQILSGIEGPFLDEVAQAFSSLTAFLAGLDPTPVFGQVEREGFDPFLARVQALDPDAITAPVRDALRSLDSLKTLLDPADEAFDELLHAIEALDPAPLLDPVAAALDTVRTEIRQTLALDRWAAQVDAVADQLLAATDLVQLANVVDGAVVLVDGFWPAPDSPQRGGIGAQALTTLLGPAAAALDVTSFAAVGDWLAGHRTPADDLAAAVTAAKGTVTTAHARVAAADPGAVAAAVTPAFGQVAAAVGALPPGERKDRLAPLVAATPVALLTAAANARGDLLTRLGTVGTQLDALGGVSASPLTTLSAALRTAFEPLATPVRASVAAWVGRAGGAPAADLRAALRDVLATLADRLRPQAEAFDTAVRAKLADAVDAAVRTPLHAAVTELDTLIGTLDVHPVVTDIEQLFAALHGPLAALRPSTALAGLVTAIDGLVGDTAAWDPFTDVRGPLDQMKADVAAVADELRPTVLLAPVVATYDTVVAALAALDVRALFDPTLTALHDLEDQVETGLAAAESAFGELQAALP